MKSAGKDVPGKKPPLSSSIQGMQPRSGVTAPACSGWSPPETRISLEAQPQEGHTAQFPPANPGEIEARWCGTGEPSRIDPLYGRNAGTACSRSPRLVGRFHVCWFRDTPGAQTTGLPNEQSFLPWQSSSGAMACRTLSDRCRALSAAPEPRPGDPCTAKAQGTESNVNVVPPGSAFAFESLSLHCPYRNSARPNLR